MIRVKLPFGGVSPDQLDVLAEVAEHYAPLKKGHITTRQNVQFHHIPLREAAKLIRLLGDHDLSSREACGNTVRNVVCDPFAGVAPGELFDPTPYAGALVRYFIRSPLTQNLPRKFKVSFSSTDQDLGISGIHDLGLIPRDQRRPERLRDPHWGRHLDSAPDRLLPVPLRVGQCLPQGGRGHAADLQPQR